MSTRVTASPIATAPTAHDAGSPRTIGSSVRAAAGWSACTPRSRAATTPWRPRPIWLVVTASGVHVHVAEGPDDVEAADRLRALSTDEWLLIHGVHLPDDHGLRGTIVHNPRSNMNNSVGYARPSRFTNSGRSRYRRHRRRHALGVPVGIRRIPRGRPRLQPRHRMGMARTGLGLVPRRARRPRHVVVRADGAVAPRLHAGCSGDRRRHRRSSRHCAMAYPSASIPPRSGPGPPSRPTASIPCSDRLRRCPAPASPVR